MNKNVLVIAAHPDDEVLGCGGSIARHVNNGEQVFVLILAEGITSRDDKRDKEKREGELSVLAKTAHEANVFLGVKSITLHDFPDNRMDSLDLLDIVKLIEKAIKKYQPHIVYTHHASDVNIDHQIVHKAVVTACRPFPGQSVRRLLFFEVPSSTEWQISTSASAFLPNWYVDISSTLDQKLRALGIYGSEMRSWPHSRSLEAVEHLARWRGANVGVQAAEAFMLGRNIVRNNAPE